ncbi:nuclear transport factor 2 family protein [Tundrisphaera sp. TA3]|uniref:nuclear transport factor 2 family protein n=1 Tax=Tundrisphaera sp. TA3 TaxID=3435775 RepID=UPI003EB80AFC
MAEESGALVADREFFAALIGGDANTLDRLLSPDFVLVDVMRGGEVPRGDLIAAVGGGLLRFEAFEPAEVKERRHGATAIVSGRTDIVGWLGDATYQIKSRYVHVYVEQDGRWQMVSAQGTPIAAES